MSRLASLFERLSWSRPIAAPGALGTDLGIGLVLLAAFAVLPLFGLSSYYIGQLIIFFMWGTVVTQWNLVFGVGGIFSLAQMALFAFGGFTTGMMGLYLGWSLWAALPLAGFGTVLVSLLVGLACLRLRGPYVALLTLAIAQVMYLLIITDTECFFMDGVTCRNFTGGTRGLAKYGDFGMRDLLGPKWAIGHYYMGLVLLALSTLVSLAIIRGPLGLAFRALRDNAPYAMARGLDRFKYQLIVFATSAFFTGVAGGFYAGHFKVIGANVLYLSLLLFLLAMIIVGGIGRVWGPILGAAALMLADEGLKDYVEWRNIGLGLVIALFAMLWPQGIAGAVEVLWRRLGRLTARAGPTALAQNSESLTRNPR
jgi:branched-chain amino acid transport system permease protein